MEPTEHAVFVYGTLTDPARARAVVSPGAGSAAAGRSSDGNRRRDSTSTRFSVVGPATLRGLHRVDGRYPTLAPGGSVDGRVLSVDGAGLERLDRYEGVDGGLYARVGVPRTTDGDGHRGADGDEHPPADGDEHRATRRDRVWTYVGDPDRLGSSEAVTWPGDGPFDRRVRRYVADHEVTVDIADEIDATDCDRSDDGTGTG